MKITITTIQYHSESSIIEINTDCGSYYVNTGYPFYAYLYKDITCCGSSEIDMKTESLFYGNFHVSLDNYKKLMISQPQSVEKSYQLQRIQQLYAWIFDEEFQPECIEYADIQKITFYKKSGKVYKCNNCQHEIDKKENNKTQ